MQRHGMLGGSIAERAAPIVVALVLGGCYASHERDTTGADAEIPFDGPSLDGSSHPSFGCFDDALIVEPPSDDGCSPAVDVVATTDFRCRRPSIEAEAMYGTSVRILPHPLLRVRGYVEFVGGGVGGRGKLWFGPDCICGGRGMGFGTIPGVHLVGISLEPGDTSTLLFHFGQGNVPDPARFRLYVCAGEHEMPR